MSMQQAIRTFGYGKGKQATYYSLPALEEAGIGPVSRLPVSLRIVLESVLRNCDEKKVTEKDVTTLARWNANHPAEEDRKSTRLNSSHVAISYAVFCLKKKKT